MKFNRKEKIELIALAAIVVIFFIGKTLIDAVSPKCHEEGCNEIVDFDENYCDLHKRSRNDSSYNSNSSSKVSDSTKSTSKNSNSYNSNDNKYIDPYGSYDDGYNDVYEEDDYDWDRYYSDDEYADGVDDALEELDY